MGDFEEGVLEEYVREGSVAGIRILSGEWKFWCGKSQLGGV